MGANLQPEMIGRESELEKLREYLDCATEGKGKTVFISGEAGVGKTRLVSELGNIAKSEGFDVLTGFSLYESLVPYFTFKEALRSGDLDFLFAEEAPRVEAVYLISRGGLLIESVVRKETELSPDIFASMLAGVANYTKETLSVLDKEEREGSLNTLGHGDKKIVIQSGKSSDLVVILTGREDEFLINDMNELLRSIDKTFGIVLDDWDGMKERVKGIDTFLARLIESGKYEGIYYGKDNPKARRDLLFENVSLGLVRKAQKEPTILCLEDLQWADPSTLSLMHYVARNTKDCRLLLLGTYRPEDIAVKKGNGHPLTSTLKSMSQEDLHKMIQLQRLPEEAIGGLLSSMLGDVAFEEKFKVQISRETEGNPLFLIQLVKLLIEEEIIKRDNGIWKLAEDYREVKIPSKVHSVVARRLDRVRHDERRILDYASVVGETFSPSVLVDVLGLEKEQLVEGLSVLEETHTLVHPDNGNYKFDHSRIKEVLYNEIPNELRMEYHSLVGNSIENIHKDNLDSVIGDLAFHYYRCRNEEKALHYLGRAAEEARKEYSNEEAIRFYSEALEFEDEPEKRIEIYERLGEIFELVGEFRRSIQSFENILETTTEESDIKAMAKARIGGSYLKKGDYSEAIRYCEEALNLGGESESDARAFALHKLGEVYSLKGDFREALRVFEKGLEIREKTGNQLFIAESQLGIGSSHYRLGDSDKALKHFKRGLEIMERLDNQPGIAQSLNNIGNIHADAGEIGKAHEYYKRSLDIRKRMGDQYGAAAASYNIGITATDREESLEYLNSATERFEKMGAYSMIGNCLNSIGNRHLNRGDYVKAEECFKKSLSKMEEIGDDMGTAIALHNLGRMQMARGDYDATLDYHNRSLEIRQRAGDQWGIAFSFDGLGDLYNRMGNYEKGLEFHSKSLEIREAIGNRANMPSNYKNIAEALLNMGDVERALEMCTKGIAIAEEVGSRFFQATGSRVLGMILSQQGEWEKSRSSLEKSISILDEMGDKEQLGESLYQFGLMWKSSGDRQKAELQLEKAIETFEKLGLNRRKREVEEVLTNLQTRIIEDRKSG